MSKWEIVHEDEKDGKQRSQTYRMRVPSGWLYRYTDYECPDPPYPEHLVFVPYAEENEETQAQLSKQAFDLALLSQGLLTGAELTEFVNRSVNLI